MSSDSPFDLTGRVALITGGNSGIGLGMAEGLAAHGADVAIWGTNAEKNERALDVLSDYDVELLSIVCDVSDESGSTRCSLTPVSVARRRASSR
jgi:NAD(P)-dependent dehydrogenase (short-subunit alcohol dehydrogenase family)